MKPSTQALGPCPRADYERRDVALQNLIQPLAGEYGVSIGMPLMKTHRKLFSEFYESVMHEPLAALLEKDPSPPLSSAFFAKMMGDIMVSTQPLRVRTGTCGCALCSPLQSSWLLRHSYGMGHGPIS